MFHSNLHLLWVIFSHHHTSPLFHLGMFFPWGLVMWDPQYHSFQYQKWSSIFVGWWQGGPPWRNGNHLLGHPSTPKLVGGLVGNNHPNWLWYFSGVGQPPTNQQGFWCQTASSTARSSGKAIGQRPEVSGRKLEICPCRSELRPVKRAVEGGSTHGIKPMIYPAW